MNDLYYCMKCRKQIPEGQLCPECQKELETDSKKNTYSNDLRNKAFKGDLRHSDPK